MPCASSATASTLLCRYTEVAERERTTAAVRLLCAAVPLHLRLKRQQNAQA